MMAGIAGAPGRAHFRWRRGEDEPPAAVEGKLHPIARPHSQRLADLPGKRDPSLGAYSCCHRIAPGDWVASLFPCGDDRVSALCRYPGANTPVHLLADRPYGLGMRCGLRWARLDERQRRDDPCAANGGMDLHGATEQLHSLAKTRSRDTQLAETSADFLQDLRRQALPLVANSKRQVFLVDRESGFRTQVSRELKQARERFLDDPVQGNLHRLRQLLQLGREVDDEPNLLLPR